MRTLAFYGAGKFAHELYDLADGVNLREGRWDQFLFIDDINGLKVSGGIPVCTFEELEAERDLDEVEFLVAVGDPLVREKMYQRIIRSGGILASLVCEGSYLALSAVYEPGVVVMPGCYVSAGVQLGANVVLYSNVSLGHGTKVGQSSLIAASAACGGNCTIGRAVFVGLNACIREECTIADRVVIGMGAVVLNSIYQTSVAAAGNPARILNERPKGLFQSCP